ncbi:MAG: ATP-dependent DNA helicase RecG, partial [Oscillospiraceae bacterium]
MMSIYDCIKNIENIGEKRAGLYNKLGIFSIKDLISYYPRKYINFKDITKINNTIDGTIYSVKGVVLEKTKTILKNNMKIYKVIITDGETKMLINIFNSEFAYDSLKIDKEFFFHGKINIKNNIKDMVNPLFLPDTAKNLIKPIYHSTKGLSTNIIEKNIEYALNLIKNSLNDPLPKNIIKKRNLCDINFAIVNIHFPNSKDNLEIAKNRLIFDELFYLQLSLKILKNKNMKSNNDFKIIKKDNLISFFEKLSFNPTNHQLKAIDDCIYDMQSNFSMNRLIQGDVGSGKTLIAMALMFLTTKEKTQSCLMAPTEILAKQHFENFNNIFSFFNINVDILTSSTTKKKKQIILEKLRSGETDILIGTHSVINDDIQFANLSLIITDEQHRFGVKQRAKLYGKGNNPHCLIMSATPIPRTLSLVIYGDLDISIINEMPNGRIPIKTFAITPSKRHRAFYFILDLLNKGEQGYIVC